jgi:hypothetical protein
MTRRYKPMAINPLNPDTGGDDADGKASSTLLLGPDTDG